MALTNRQKWGIGLVATSIAGAIAGGFAIGNADMPAIVYTMIGVAEGVLLALGITNFQKPPLPPA